MKINLLLVSSLIIVKNTLAQDNALSNIIESKTVVDPSSGECKVVNKLLNKDESYDCCNLVNIVECENRHITKIHIENKNITGHIPEEIGNLIYLRELWLDHNELNGQIPSSIGNIVYLKDLSLGANNLYGPIPAELSKLTDLEKLNLYENELNGKIPHELAELPNLWHLDFHNNSLHGEIPYQLGKLSKLKTLNLDNNELDITSVPQEVQNLPNLTEFHYSNQREHKDYYDDYNQNRSNRHGILYVLAMILAFIIYCSPIIILAIICAWIKGMIKERREKKKNWKVLNDNDSGNRKKQGNNSNTVENNHIAVTVDSPKTTAQPEKSDVNTSLLKQKIEQQEQQLQEQMKQQQLQLQQIQQMKNQLQQYEQPSSSTSTTEPKSSPKTKEQEAQENRLQNQNLSYNYNTIPKLDPSVNVTPVNANNSFIPSAPVVYDDDLPSYNDALKNGQ